MKKVWNSKGLLITGAVIICVLLVIFIGWVIVHQREVERRRANTKTFVTDRRYDEMLYLEAGAVNTNNLVVVTADDTDALYTSLIVPGRYVFLADCEYKYNDEEDIMEVERAKYTVCDLMTGAPLRTIDVKKIADRLEPDKVIRHPDGGYIVIEEGGDIYLSFNLMNRKDMNDKTQWRQLYINMETREDPMQMRGDFIRMRGDNLELAETLTGEEGGEYAYGVLVMDEIGLIKANGFEPYYSERYRGETAGMKVTDWGYDVAQIEMPKKYLPESNETLYKEFPGLKNYEGSEEDIVTFYIGGAPTAEEILKLFLEDGEGISFEGCVLPAKLSIDEQDHEIRSFDEYEQWYKY